MRSHGELQRFGTNIDIIVGFVSPSEAMDVLCSAHLSGFKWPDYAWEISKPKTLKINCQVEALNNALFLRLTHANLKPQEVLLSGFNYSAYYDAYLQELE